MLSFGFEKYSHVKLGVRLVFEIYRLQTIFKDSNLQHCWYLAKHFVSLHFAKLRFRVDVHSKARLFILESNFNW